MGKNVTIRALDSALLREDELGDRDAWGKDDPFAALLSEEDHH